MLLIPTIVKKSEIDGLGVFTEVNIPKDSCIWKWNKEMDFTLTYEQLDQFPQWQQEYFLKYCFEQNGILFYCIDNGRFFNHSDEPNCYEKDDCTYAKRNIMVGEELTSNYNEFSW